MKLVKLFESSDRSRVLHDDDEIIHYSKTCLMLTEPGHGFFVDVYSDIPAHITDQQFDQLLRKSFTESQYSQLKDIQTAGVLHWFPPKRYPPERVEQVLSHKFISPPQFSLTTWSWKRDRVKALILMLKDENDFEDD